MDFTGNNYNKSKQQSEHENEIAKYMRLNENTKRGIILEKENKSYHKNNINFIQQLVA